LSPESRILRDPAWLVGGALENQIPVVPRTGDLPLSLGQERLWSIYQDDPEECADNCPEALRLVGWLDVRALQHALCEIVRRHEVLRTTFVKLGGQPFQRVGPAVDVTLPILDLTDLPEDERESEAARVMREEARRAFDLSQKPAFSVSLFRLADEVHLLLFVWHHIVYDRWSYGVFLGELTSLYGACVRGGSMTLPPLPIQYGDFACWQRETLRGDALENLLSYWKRQLRDGVPSLQLHTDRPRPAVQTYHGSRVLQILPRALADGLKTLSRRENVTLYMTLLAAFQTLLSRYSGQITFAVGSPIANRTLPELEPLFGFFANMIVLRADLSGSPTFREVLARVREVALQAYTYQDLPFAKLVEALDPQRDLSRHPLFQVTFVFQNTPLATPEMPGLRVGFEDVDLGTSQYDLSLFVRPTEAGLLQRLEYNADLFNSDTVGTMLGHLRTLLDAVVANPDCRVLELPLLR